MLQPAAERRSQLSRECSECSQSTHADSCAYSSTFLQWVRKVLGAAAHSCWSCQPEWAMSLRPLRGTCSHVGGRTLLASARAVAVTPPPPAPLPSPDRIASHGRCSYRDCCHRHRRRRRRVRPCYRGRFPRLAVAALAVLATAAMSSHRQGTTLVQCECRLCLWYAGIRCCLSPVEF